MDLEGGFSKLFVVLSLLTSNEPFFSIPLTGFYTIITPSGLIISCLVISAFYLINKYGSKWAAPVVSGLSVLLLTVLISPVRTNELGISFIFILIYLYRAFEGVCLVHGLDKSSTPIRGYCLVLTVVYVSWLFTSDPEVLGFAKKFPPVFFFIHIVVFYFSIVGAYSVCDDVFSHDHFGYTTIFIAHLVSVAAIALCQNHIYYAMLEDFKPIFYTYIHYSVILPIAFVAALLVKLINFRLF